MVTEVIRLRARPRGRRKVTVRYESAAERTATPEALWHGGRVKIEDLPAFKARWGLAVVGSEWPEGAPCPTLYLRDKPGRGR